MRQLLLLAIIIGDSQGATIAPLRRRTPSALTGGARSLQSLCKLRGGAAERTFAMLKPDVAGDAGTVAAIKERIEGAGLTIEREERCKLSRRDCEIFYAEHAERAFFGGLVSFMSSGPVVKLELSGKDAIKRWRALIGPTSSEKARVEAPSSLRALYGTDNQRNAAHGSDSVESAERELALMFK